MDLVTAILIVLALVAVLVAAFVIIGRIREKPAPEEKRAEEVQEAEIDGNTAEETEETEEQPEKEPQKAVSAKGICSVCGERLNGQDSFCPVCGEKV